MGPRFRFHESFMCAGGEPGEDTCVKDGGGPLVCPSERDSDYYVQAGITAWGIGCGDKDVPGAYASVNHALCFIKRATQCVHGDKYKEYYDVGSCVSFIDDEITKVDRELQRLESTVRSDGTYPSSKIARRVNFLRNAIAKAEEMEASCDLNPRSNN